MTRLTIQQLSDFVLSSPSCRELSTCTLNGEDGGTANVSCAELLEKGVEEHFLFLKPELLSIKQEDVLRQAMEVVFTPLMNIGEIDQAVLLAADSVEARSMVQGQYHVLRSLATQRSPWAIQAVLDSLHDCIQSTQPEKVYSASEALELFWSDDAAQLSKEWDEGACVKAGPGLYACRFTKAAETFVVLNGFYPSQESWLCQPAGRLLCFRLRTTMPLRQVRERVVGSVEPRLARPGSIRHQLYIARKQLGLSDISISRNALHIAPNALDSLLGVSFMCQCSEASGEVELFRRYVGLHQPTALSVLNEYVDGNEFLSFVHLMLHTRCEDLTYRECLNVMSARRVDKSEFLIDNL